MLSRRCVVGLFVVSLPVAAVAAEPGHPAEHHHRTERHYVHRRDEHERAEHRADTSRSTRHVATHAAAVAAAAGAGAAASVVAPKVIPPKPPVGASTGLPIPRFAALRADEVNMRAGPGMQYPIEWVFKHQDMPIEIEREFDVWRYVRAPDGTQGWVHQATLVGSRTFVVPAGGGDLPLRAEPSDTGRDVALLKPDVIGHLVRCKLGDAWCYVSVHGYRGYVPRTGIWGVLPDEVVGGTG